MKGQKWVAKSEKMVRLDFQYLGTSADSVLARDCRQKIPPMPFFFFKLASVYILNYDHDFVRTSLFLFWFYYAVGCHQMQYVIVINKEIMREGRLV